MLRLGLNKGAEFWGVFLAKINKNFRRGGG